MLSLPKNERDALPRPCPESLSQKRRQRNGGLALQYVTQYINKGGPPDEAFVLFQDQDLDVTQRREVGIVQTQFQYVIGHAAEARGLAVIIDVQPGKAVVLDQDASGQMTETVADDGDFEVAGR